MFFDSVAYINLLEITPSKIDVSILLIEKKFPKCYKAFPKQKKRRLNI